MVLPGAPVNVDGFHVIVRGGYHWKIHGNSWKSLGIHVVFVGKSWNIIGTSCMNNPLNALDIIGTSRENGALMGC